MIKVSIIVPIYNVEKYLRRCLESIINQTLKDIEIILVDDNSIDRCPIICDEYAEIDKRIIVIHKKKNEGLGLARNSGIEIAKGQYLAFVDSDDYIDFNFYEQLYNNRDDADIIYGSSKDEYNGKTIGVYDCPLEKLKYENEEIIPEVLYNMIGYVNKGKAIGFTSCKSLYKREIFEKYDIRFFSERKYISEDLIFNLEYIPKCKKIKFVNNVYYHYCHNNSDSLTKRYNQQRFVMCKKLYLELVNRTKKMNIYRDVEKGLNYSFIGNVRVCIKQEKVNEKDKALEKIKQICEDDLVQKVLRKEYDKSIKQKLFDSLIKIKKYKMLYLIIKKK